MNKIKTFLRSALIALALAGGMQASAQVVHVYTYIVVPSDLTWSQQEVDSVTLAMRDIQAWFQFRTCGSTFNLPDPFQVQIYNCQHDRAYYDDDWWGLLLPEMQAAGVPVWESDHILALWIKGVSGAGIGLGAHWCNDYCGVAMASVEGWPAFNPGTYCDACPGNSNSSGSVWPCVPRGTMAHELGHAFGLPHSEDDSYGGANNGLTAHSVMQQHWHFPYWYATGNAAPWGLLSTEVERLWGNVALSREVQLVQSYPDAPLVNLPMTGELPVADFMAVPEGDSIRLLSMSIGEKHYWIFGDQGVSTEVDPLIPRPVDDLEVQLIVANDYTMMARATQVVGPSVGVGERFAGEARIFPNPATGLLYVERPWAPGDQWGLYAVNGVRQEVPATRHGDRLVLDLSGLPGGIYMVELVGGQGREMHRVVVAR